MKTATFTIARPDTGAVLPYASVTVYETDGITKATIVDANGNQITGSALTADINGSITFGAPDGTYVLRAVSADAPPLTVPDIKVDLYDFPAIQAAITQALSALTAAQGFCNALSVPATALPYEVTAITGGIGTGSGGTPGIYNLGVTDGPTGFKATVTIGGDGKIAGYTIDNPGIAATNGAPTLSLSGVTGLTGATTPTATVDIIPVNRLFLAPSTNGLQLLTWYNKSGTGLNQYPDAPAGQFSFALGDFILSMLNYIAVPGGDDALVIGKRGKPKLARIRKSTGGFDFLGVHTLPIMADDNTIVATFSGKNGRSNYLFSAFDRKTRTTLFGLKKNGTFVANIEVAEVTAARGTAPDLSAFLLRGHTPAGSPKTGAQNLGRLRGLRSGLTYLKNGGSALVHIILDGDSWWDAKNYGSTDAITRFFADSGLTNAGPGWIGAASPVSSSFGPHSCAQNNISVTRSGTWTDLFRSADGSPGTIQNYPGYDAAQSGADGSIYAFAGSTMGNCISITAYCEKGSGVEQSWDGVVYSSLTVASGTGPTTAAVTPSPSASFTGSITGTTLTVSGVTGTITPEMVLAGAGVLANTKIVSGSGTTWTVSVNHATPIGPVAMTGKSNTLRLRFTNTSKFGGLFGLTATSGVVFSNLSNSGSTAAQKATVQSNADYKAIMATFPGDVMVPFIQLSLNDTKAGTANATIVTNVAAVAAGYRAIFGGYKSNDIAILCQPNTPLSVQDALSPLLRSWAEDNDAAFYDWQINFGVPASSGDYASYSRDYTSGAASTALPLLQVSTAYRHPSTPADLIAAGEPPALCGAMEVASTLSNLFLSPFRSL